MTLWIRTLEDVQPRPLAGSENGTDPFWSPDSRHLAFFANGRLKRIELATGSVTDVCEASANPRGGTWNADGIIVFGDAAAQLHRVSASGGTVTDATINPAGEGSHRWPSFLPDGRRFLYFARGDEQKRGIYVGTLDGALPVHLFESTSNALYADAHLLTVRDSTLLAYPFDQRTARITGEPITVASQVAGSSTQQAPISVSATGVLAIGAPLQNETQLGWFDRSGKPAGPPIQTGNFVNFRLSPDQKAAAVTRIDPLTNTADIWQVDLDRSVSTRMTSDRMNDMGPVWSPDQDRIVFRSARAGGNFLFGIAFRGATREALLLKREISSWPGIRHNRCPQLGDGARAKIAGPEIPNRRSLTPDP